MLELLVSLVVLMLFLKTALILAGFFVRLLAICILLVLVLGLAGHQNSYQHAWNGDSGGEQSWTHAGESTGSAYARHPRPLSTRPIPDSDTF
jgi:uncharacterized membrane protein YphA (DoxX/SURF4 family)